MNKIKLLALPYISSVDWQDFIHTHPSFSIALDGYVSDSTKIYKEKRMVNFNHHENVDRLSTKATCSQVLIAIRMGLFDFFKSPSQDNEIKVYVNHCDEDICTSWFLLKYGYMDEYILNPKLTKLVTMEDSLDSTSGAYPYPKRLPILKELAWVFEPYRKAKREGILNVKETEIYEKVIIDVEERIKAHISGNGEKISLDTKYKVLSKHDKWCMVEEIGDYAKTGMMSNGIKAYLSVKERNNGRWNYVIGRISPFIDFDIDLIIKKLNEAENSEKDKWGGANIIGGSPRVNGSKLSPAEVEKIINNNII